MNWSKCPEVRLSSVAAVPGFDICGQLLGFSHGRLYLFSGSEHDLASVQIATGLRLISRFPVPPTQKRHRRHPSHILVPDPCFHCKPSNMSGICGGNILCQYTIHVISKNAAASDGDAVALAARSLLLSMAHGSTSIF